MDGFADLLNSAEDKGVKAALDALKEMDIIRFDYNNLAFKVISPMAFTEEAFMHYVNKSLGRK